MINETDYTNNPLTKEQENQIDALFTQFDTTDKPGCSIGVIKDGQFIYKKNFGMANLDYDIPITADSRFELASVSKQFYAACIALLYLDGKLDLDDDVRKYIPELPDYGKAITIRHLLYHTSGIKDYPCLLDLVDFYSVNYLSTANCVKMVVKQKSLNFKPGSQFLYSNSGYLLLSEIIRLVSGKSIGEYAEDNIFKPLNMNDTGFNENYRRAIKNRVMSYDVFKDEVQCNFNNCEVPGGGNVISTLDDLLKWDNNFHNPQVGGKAFLELMLSEGFLDNKNIIPYGFGVMHFNFSDTHAIWHTGSFLGFRSMFVNLIDKKVSIFILANHSEINTEILVRNIQNVIVPVNFIIPPQPIKQNESVCELIELKQSKLEHFCGYYWCEKDNLKRRIIQKDSELYYWRNDQNESKLLPISHSELMLDNLSSKVKLIFEFDRDKTSMQLFDNNRCISIFNKYQPVEYDVIYLSRFIGKYYNDELEITYQFVIKEDRFVLLIKDMYVAVPSIIIPNLFEIKKWDAKLKFVSNNDHEIIGLTIDSNRAKNIKFVKQS